MKYYLYRTLINLGGFNMEMTCTSDPNFLATSIAVMILLLLPMALPVIQKLPGFNMSIVSSIGGGMAMAAVFAFMVPDVVSKIAKVAKHTDIEFFQHHHHLMLLVFATFLLAFCTMYALEKVALEKTKANAEPSTFVFYLHMGILCSMLICLVSSFPALAKSSFYAIGIVCALAVFEIFLEEVALLKHFALLYTRLGRYMVMLSILIGWAIGLKFFKQESTVFTLMVQTFVIGMILTAVVKGEFDLINQSNNYITFLISAAIKVLIVLGLILIEDAADLAKEKSKIELPEHRSNSLHPKEAASNPQPAPLQPIAPDPQLAQQPIAPDPQLVPLQPIAPVPAPAPQVQAQVPQPAPAPQQAPAPA